VPAAAERDAESVMERGLRRGCGDGCGVQADVMATVDDPSPWHGASGPDGRERDEIG
jgi:hypothetical protein